MKNLGVPHRGLVIMAEPLEKILNGRKRLELRKSGNRVAGPVALIQKGSGHVLAVAEIGESGEPMAWTEFGARASEHCVDRERLKEVYDTGYVYGWPLTNVRRLARPVPCQHPAGAVIWVKLDEECVRALTVELSGPPL